MARSHTGPKSLARSMERRGASSREHAEETTDQYDTIRERARASVYERVAQDVREAVEQDGDLGSLADTFERKATSSREHAEETTDQYDQRREYARAQVWDEAARQLRETISDE
ncbi:MAG: hypothetical protein ACI9CA_000002 [Natronomonas sp.]|jgi:hypothetical protein